MWNLYPESIKKIENLQFLFSFLSGWRLDLQKMVVSGGHMGGHCSNFYPFYMLELFHIGLVSEQKCIICWNPT